MKEKKKLLNSKTFMISMISVFILLIAVGVTYAWYVWNSTDNTNITMQIGEYTTVTFTGGNEINATLYPVYNYTDGESTTFTLTNNNTSSFKPFNYNVYFDVTTLPTELKSSSLKYVLLDGSSNIVGQGDFSTVESGSRLTVTENKPLPNGSSSYTFIIYLDGNVENSSSMTNKTVSGSLRVTAVQGSVTANAAQYVTNLYTNAEKTTAQNGPEGEEITYNLASSEGLMNDRLGGTTESLDGGDIRYYGANPNNYVWLGDTYTSTYTFDSNGSSITRNVGDKKLWRIIGVFDGRLKLISNDPISGNTGLSWDTSDSSVNEGFGINQWGESTYSDTGEVYSGADLMRLLNPGYEEESINNSLYWNKETGTVYTAKSTTSDVSFANTGLSSAEQNMIDTATWYLGAYNGIASFVNTQYLAERQSSTLGKNSYNGNHNTDKVARTPTWDGKVGLMYPSDYGYATDLTTCNQKIYSSSVNSYACRTNDWLFDSSMRRWTLSPFVEHAASDRVLCLGLEGSLSRFEASSDFAVRPAIYLKSGVMVTDGSGTEQEPYVLEYQGQ